MKRNEDITHIVRGVVRPTDGSPATGLKVKVFDRNIGEDDTFLCEATTDSQGNYSIAYTLNQLGGKPNADLVIRVLQENQLLQTLDVIFNAKQAEIIDLTIPKPTAPELQRQSETLQPLLRGGLGLGGLSRKEIGFLSKKTGMDTQKIEWLAQSHRLAGENQTLATFYYGLLSQNFPTAPSALLSRDRASIRRALRLGDLTRRHLPLMQHLQESLRDERDASLKSLAKLGRDQWIDKAYAYGVPEDSGLHPDAYARQLERSVEELHPTAIIAARLDDGSLRLVRPGFDKVGTFLQNNPSFDLLQTNIRAFVDKANLSGIDHKDELVQSLLKLQRVRKLSATWDEAGALLNQGLDSALQVVALGQVRLQQRLSGDVAPEQAALIYQTAKQTHDLGLALMTRIMPRFSPTAVAAMGRLNFLSDETISKFSKSFRIFKRSSALRTTANATRLARSSARQPISSTFCSSLIMPGP